MLEIKYTNPNYTALLQQIGIILKAPVKDNAMFVPLGLGTGWVWTEQLPCGITVLVSDTKLNTDISFIRTVTKDAFFSLNFDELYTETRKAGNLTESLVQSSVKLTQTADEVSIFTIPAGVRSKSLKFYFNKQQLSQLIDEESLNRLFNYNLIHYLAVERKEIIDVHYRSILDELLVPHIEHPLRINFIQNRILLLLENFIDKQQKAKIIPLKHKVNASDLERLMQAESLLVKDFSKAPPTIDKLSKICAMSATKLKNEFKFLYGLPIYEYYQKNRMAKAKSILLEGHHTCKEVGLSIGYSNLSHFAASFKKEFGVSPSDLLAKQSKVLYAV